MPPKVIQATPSGVLVDLDNGAEPVMMPEDVAVRAGLMPPTPGLYQQPQQVSFGVDPDIAAVAQGYSQPAVDIGVTRGAVPMAYQATGAAPLQAAPGNPPPTTFAPMPPKPALPQPPAQSQSMGASASQSGQTLVRRDDVTRAPAPLDAKPYMDAYGAAVDEQQGAIDKAAGHLDQQAAAQIGLGQVQSEYATKGADYNEDFMAMQAEVNGVVQEAVAQKAAAINERIARVPQEDPAKIWGDNNAFQNAAGLLAAYMGGVLAVTTGSGRNMGLEAVERAIDRNIAAQRTNIENEWKKIAHDKDSLQAYKDWQVQSRAWEHEQRAVMLETLALNREAESLKFSSPSKAAELMGQAAQLRAQSALAQQEYIKSVFTMANAEAEGAFKRWAETEKLSLDKLNSAASRSLQYAQADKLRAETGAQAGGGGPIPVFKLPNGEQLYLDPKFTQGRTPAQVGEMANKLGEETAKYALPIDAMQRHRQLVAEIGSKYAGPGSATLRWGTEDMKTVKDSLERTSAAIAKSLSGSQYAEAFREAVKKWTGDAPGWTGQSPVQSQTQYIEDMLSDMDRDLGGRGVIKGTVKQVGAPGAAPAVQGPTESGRPVLPKGVEYETTEPLNSQRSFYRGDVVLPEQKDVVKGATDLGRTIMTGNDPSSTLQALNQLDNMLAAPLASTPAVMKQIFGAAEVSDVGGKAAVRYPGEGSKQAGTKVRSQEEGIRLMKANAARAAVKADRAGDPRLASEIVDAANRLERRMLDIGAPPRQEVLDAQREDAVDAGLMSPYGLGY